MKKVKITFNNGNIEERNVIECRIENGCLYMIFNDGFGDGIRVIPMGVIEDVRIEQ